MIILIEQMYMYTIRYHSYHPFVLLYFKKIFLFSNPDCQLLASSSKVGDSNSQLKHFQDIDFCNSSLYVGISLYLIFFLTGCNNQNMECCPWSFAAYTIEPY